jgi:hypothetical protein
MSSEDTDHSGEYTDHFPNQWRGTHHLGPISGEDTAHLGPACGGDTNHMGPISAKDTDHLGQSISDEDTD